VEELSDFGILDKIIDEADIQQIKIKIRPKFRISKKSTKTCILKRKDLVNGSDFRSNCITDIRIDLIFLKSPIAHISLKFNKVIFSDF